MTKKRTSPDTASHQLLLPIHSGGTNGIRAGRLQRHEAIREAIVMTLGNSSLSREAFAAEMSRLTGESITVNHLNNWCSEAKGQWRFPLEYAAAFALVGQDFGIIAAGLDGTGQILADERTMKAARLGQLVAEKRRRAKEERELYEELV